MIRGLVRLPQADRALVVRVGLLVAAIRIALWAAPFVTLQRLLRHTRVKALLRANVREQSVDRLTWAVRAASQRIPAATCLTQSLALQTLLTAARVPAALHIGVRRNDEGFRAHAWVDCEGRTPLDRPSEIASYARLASWEN